jgi:hypothetical protein
MSRGDYSFVHIVMEVNYKQHLCASRNNKEVVSFIGLEVAIFIKAIVGIIQTSRLIHVLAWPTF